MIARVPWLLTAAALLTPASAAELDAAALIARLARPAPASIGFTEVRLSPLLREPLTVSGELGYAGPDNLDRRVTQPYEELTQIRGESVRVERTGEAVRSFALRRAPELRSLLASFAALLSGDLAGIERAFDVQVSGSEQTWTLQLTPRDAKTRRRLQRIEISGHGELPRCFAVLNADGGASVMLLGDESKTDVRGDVTLESLAARCGLALTAR